MTRNVKRMSDNAIDLLPNKRQLTVDELYQLMGEDSNRDKLDAVCEAFYFGVAVTVKAIKDGVLTV